MAGQIDERWDKSHSGPSTGLPHAAGAFFGRQLNVYWLWLVVVFGGIAVIPWNPLPEKTTGRTQYLPVANAYTRPDLFDDWQTTLILHTLATLFVAVPAAVCHSVLRRHHGHTEPAHFSLRQLCMGTGILALVFGLLAWRGAPAAVSYAVVLMFSGWPTMLILAGIISRGRLAHPSTGSDETDETSADPG